MLTKEEFQEALGQSVWLLDGATGSWLRKMGMPRDCATEEWVLRNPEVLVQLQQGYAQAGGTSMCDVCASLYCANACCQCMGGGC